MLDVSEGVDAVAETDDKADAAEESVVELANDVEPNAEDELVELTDEDDDDDDDDDDDVKEGLVLDSSPLTMKNPSFPAQQAVASRPQQ